MMSTVSIAATVASVSEPHQDQTSFVISRPGNETTGDLTVYFDITGTASSGDYGLSAGTADHLTILDGSATASLVLTPVPDSNDEDDETVQVSIRTDSGHEVGTPGSASITIDDSLSTVDLVRDINFGSTGSGIANAVDVGGILYFAANDGSHGSELWRSDGTAAGTYIVKDIKNGSAGSSPAYLTNVNGMLFFVADDGIHDAELWKSDGTEAGTVLVKDINPNGGNTRSS